MRFLSIFDVMRCFVKFFYILDLTRRQFCPLEPYLRSRSKKNIVIEVSEVLWHLRSWQLQKKSPFGWCHLPLLMIICLLWVNGEEENTFLHASCFTARIYHLLHYSYLPLFFSFCKRLFFLYSWKIVFTNPKVISPSKFVNSEWIVIQ